MRWLRRSSDTLAYGATVAVLAFAALALIPAMISSSGLDAWGRIASGQALGVLGATLINYGWPITGPTIVASMSLANRRDELLVAAKTRLTLSLVVAPAAIAVSLLILPGSLFDTVSGVLLGLSLGYGLNWYFIGARRPWQLFLLDTAPRASVSAVAIAMLHLGLVPAWGGATIVAAGVVFAALISHITVLLQLPRIKSEVRLQTVRETLSSRRSGVVVATTGNVSVTVPLLIMNIVSPQNVGLFAIIERPTRQLLSALSVIVNQVQGAFSDTKRTNYSKFVRHQLRRFTVLMIPLYGLLLVGSYILLNILSEGVHLPAWGGVSVATLTLLYFIETTFTRALIPPLDKMRALAGITSWSLLATAPAVMVGGLVAGAFGGIVAVGLVALVKTVMELIIVLQATRPGSSTMD